MQLFLLTKTERKKKHKTNVREIINRKILQPNQKITAKNARLVV
jgi:hypothetical protein